MRSLARSAAGRFLLLSGQTCVPGVSGATSYAPSSAVLAAHLGQTAATCGTTGGRTPSTVVWGPLTVPGRWFGSHISRQDDKKGSGKSKKKKGGVPGQKWKKKRPSVTLPINESAEAATREEAEREEAVREQQQKRQQHPPEASAVPSAGGDAPFSYVGPFSSAVRKVKKLSLFSCFVTLSSVPVMMYLDPAVLVEGAAGTSMTARMSLAGSLSAFGVGTTGLLHWFVSPYVHWLTYRGGKLRVETLDLLARPRITELALQDVDGGASDSMHPLSTFRDRRDGRVYYVDKDYFHHDELLAVLAPEKDGDGDGEGDKGWSD